MFIFEYNIDKMLHVGKVFSMIPSDRTEKYQKSHMKEKNSSNPNSIPVQFIQDFQNAQEQVHDVQVDGNASDDVVLLTVVVLEQKKILKFRQNCLP